MASAILRVLSDPEGAAALGARAREQVIGRYSWAAAMHGLEVVMAPLFQGSMQRCAA